MSKYKVGDKVVMEILRTDDDGYYEFGNDNRSWWWFGTYINEISEPLSTYTEPLEAEITRLLAENERLKDEYEKMYATIEDYESYESQGAETAWELARKIMLYDEEAYSGKELKEIFDCTHTQEIIRNHTYYEAATKVAEWEEAKEEIKAGDVLEYIYNSNVKCVVVKPYSSNMAYLVFNDESAGLSKLDNLRKTGRHIDVDSFLKQIGEK